MKAVVANKSVSPNVLQIQERRIPDAKPGWVLVRVRAAGLNRSEMYSRQDHSPGVEFPRVLGIECVGEVAQDGIHKVLGLVATMMRQDSFACMRICGTVCLTGVMANKWVIKDWEPFLFIKPGEKFTTGGITGVLRHSDPNGIMQEIYNIVAAGRYKHGLHKVFPLNKVATAHQYLEDNQTIGKLVLEIN